MSNTNQAPLSCGAPISDWELQNAAYETLKAELFALNKVAFFDAITPLGVIQVVVTFDGYGDSGQIENIEIRGGGDPIPEPTVIIEFAEAEWGQAEPSRSSVSIASAAERLTYDVLERTHSGWENSDGAYGDVTFDVGAREITLDYNERYTSSENYVHTF
jgi:hypothetical protein